MKSLWVVFSVLCVVSASLVYSVSVNFQLQNELSKAFARNDSLSRELQDLSANYSMLKGEYERLNASYGELEKTHYELLANYTDLESAYHKVLDAYDAEKAGYEVLLDEYEKLNASYQQLLAEYSVFSANYSALLDEYEALNASYYSLMVKYDELTQNYVQLQSEYQQLHNVLYEPLENRTIPTRDELESWLKEDPTNLLNYSFPNFVCGDFAVMLSMHAKLKGWRMGVVGVLGHTQDGSEFDHAFNAIICQEGLQEVLFYVEPQSDVIFQANISDGQLYYHPGFGWVYVDIYIVVVLYE
ncbi:MAG: hypothetical protein ACPLW5_05525 [Candidatus Bathyarchaeales archaeon]